jgi:6-phosphogluconolactonase
VTAALWGIVHVAADADRLFDALASVLMGAAFEAVRERGIFHLAVSGGSTPEPFYMRLIIDPRYRAMPWLQTHLWMVDERRVGQDDPLSNYRMICESLADHADIPPSQRHPMPVASKNPAGAYEEELRRFFGEDIDVPRMDFILLGMGEDGHTASLFPHSSALVIRDRWIAVNEDDHVTPPRVTMTYPLINAAKEIAILVTGENKADTVRRVAEQMKDGVDPAHLPITGVRPTHGGRLVWYLDAAAAGQLPLG